MPRYFFDLVNGDGVIRDEMGSELPQSRDSLLREVSRILTDLAREELTDREHGGISVTVRDDCGRSVLSGSLDFRTNWES
ncbi:DUF6894 family protein [Rhizobium halophilum]|uniref:DUF6894 family protein n=1 Tax=Rhizobium halophilum TaxID=2846852 RepID=UPI001EFD49D7|nr:hypothetical protein [Rhizobium halophilum]MCF6368565.1 hypothetical protein [Rhizobium halophilum]